MKLLMDVLKYQLSTMYVGHFISKPSICL